MEKRPSFFQRLQQELYSLPKERPLAFTGLAIALGGAIANISSTEICLYAKAWVEPFNTISQIGQYAFVAGSVIWLADIFRRYKKLNLDIKNFFKEKLKSFHQFT